MRPTSILVFVVPEGGLGKGEGRWETFLRSRGDPAFVCDDAGMRDELTSWAKTRDNGNPRCTDDLDQPEFADLLADLAETHHLGKCVDAAFVGTEEAYAEAFLACIDDVFD